MQYLAPNDVHILNVPVVVGAEYTVPTADGKLTTRIGLTTETTIIPKVESSTLDVPLNTPNVLPGQLQILSVMLTIPTAAGILRYRENFGVIDLMDIPATGETVRRDRRSLCQPSGRLCAGPESRFPCFGSGGHGRDRVRGPRRQREGPGFRPGERGAGRSRLIGKQARSK